MITIQIKTALLKDNVRILIKILTESHLAFDLEDKIGIRLHTNIQANLNLPLFKHITHNVWLVCTHVLKMLWSKSKVSWAIELNLCCKFSQQHCYIEHELTFPPWPPFAKCSNTASKVSLKCSFTKCLLCLKQKGIGIKGRFTQNFTLFFFIVLFYQTPRDIIITNLLYEPLPILIIC